MRRVNVWLIAAALLALSNLGVQSCPGRPPEVKVDKDGANAKSIPVESVEFTVHYDQWKQYTLKVPADWDLEKRSENPVLFASAPGAGIDGPLVNVVVESLTQRMDPYQYLYANVPAMQMSIKDLNIIEGGVEPLPGSGMAWIHYEYPNDGKPVEAMSFCQTRDFSAWVVTTKAPKAMFESYKALFKAMGGSLRIMPR